jgi:hypothetical protein
LDVKKDLVIANKLKGEIGLMTNHAKCSQKHVVYPCIYSIRKGIGETFFDALSYCQFRFDRFFLVTLFKGTERTLRFEKDFLTLREKTFVADQVEAVNQKVPCK